MNFGQNHLVKEIGCRQAFFSSKFENFTVFIDLKIRSRSLIKSLIHTNVTIYMNFSQNPSFASRDRVQTSFFGQNLKFSKCWYDLENEANVTKI